MDGAGPARRALHRLADRGQAPICTVLTEGESRAAWEQVIFRVDALHRLENAGVRVINAPPAVERAVDKYYTSTLLEDAGLPTPCPIVAEQFDHARVLHNHPQAPSPRPLTRSSGAVYMQLPSLQALFSIAKGSGKAKNEHKINFRPHM